VKSALQKDGWRITHDPLLIRIENITDMYIDLGAERIIAAEREGQVIAVEVKSFIGTSTIYEFHTAVGQFINYRYALLRDRFRAREHPKCVKTYFVIASVMKWSEAIAKSRCCDCCLV
jgi:hypothetical protein